MLSFADAVKTCVVRKPLNFRDRAPRSEFWWFYLALWIGTLICRFIMVIPRLGVILGLIYGIAAFVMLLSAAVRRLHDTGRSGWWMAAFYGVMILVALLRPRSMLMIALPAVITIVLLIFLIMPGTKGPNRFGPDPLAPAAAPAQPQPRVQLPRR